jgi:hypothetical protein
MEAPEPPSRRAGAPLVAAGIGLALAVAAAVASGARHDSGGRQLRMPNVGKPLVALFAVVLVAAAGLLIATIASGRRRPFRERSTRAQLLALVLPLLLACAAMLFIRYFRADHRPSTPPEATDPESGQDPPAQPAPAGNAGDAALVVAVLAAGAVLTVIAARRFARPPAASPADDVALAVSDVLDDVIDDLRRESDPRRAVIGAYERMEQTLAHHGMPRRLSEAPLEYVSRALTRLRAGAPAVAQLTSLFEWAMFSPHTVDRSMQEAAIAALVTVRDDVRAAALTSTESRS